MLYGRLSLSFSFIHTAVSISLLISGNHLILLRTHTKRAAKGLGLLPPLGSPHGAGFNIADSELAYGLDRLISSSPIHCCGQVFFEMLQALNRLLLS